MKYSYCLILNLQKNTGMQTLHLLAYADELLII